MTAPIGAIAEAEKAAIAFQAALLKLGVKTIAEALRLWRRVPPTQAAQVADDWLDDAVHLIMTRRTISRDLAVAYYRLARALRTGTTVPDPYDPIPETVTLAQLRFEFKRLTDSIDAPAENAPKPVTVTPPTTDTPPPPAEPERPTEPVPEPEPVPTEKPAETDPDPEPEPLASLADDTVIPIERIEGFDEDGDSERERIEREAEQEARIVLAALGPERLKRDVAAIDTTRPADEVDEKRDEAHSKAGSRQAAAADRIVKNGARAEIHSLADRDPRVIGYVRRSRTGTPCGWCAMLISRGLIFYKSEHSATYGSDGEKYHDNCNCYAEPVYSRKQYHTSDLFALNREYDRLWPIVTKGLRGKAALTAWRRYFRNAKKTGDSDTGEAQAA